MTQEKSPSPRKKRLCSLLRSVAQCFIEQTTGPTPAEIRESTALRNQTDSLVTLYETGHLDPVASLETVSIHVDAHPPSQELAPLTGTAS